MIGDYAAEFWRLSDLMDKSIDNYREAVRDAATAERDYRLLKARKWAEAPTAEKRGEWTAAQREAWVNAETANARMERDIAEGVRFAAYEAVRNYRAQLSSLQSLLNADRAEAEFARTGPRLEP